MTELARHPSDWQTYRRLLGYVLPMWPLFLICIGGYALFNGAQVLLADMMQFIVDTIGGEEQLARGVVASTIDRISASGLSQDNALFWIPVAILFMGVMRGVGFFVGNYFLHQVARELVHRLRCHLFDQLLVSPSRQYDQHSSGYLISKITFNVEQVTGAATDAVKVVLRDGLYVIGLLSYLFYMSVKLSLLFLAVLPLVALIVVWVGKRFRRISRRLQNSIGDVTHVANESINGYREVRLFGGTEQERERFLAASRNNRRQSLKMAFYNAISPPVIQFPVIIALTVLIWQAMNMLVDMSAGQFVAYITVAMLLPKPIRELSEVNSTIQKGLAGAEDVFAFIDSERERDAGHYTAERVRGQIDFRNVTFAYQAGAEPVLKDVSFSIEPGQSIALVGLSGSGKSTLVSLLSRFYEHEEGQILLDGVDVNDYQLANLRSHIGLVTQQVTLFNDTVSNNIAYGGMSGASREQVVAALRDAHALEFVERLPQGLDTVIGEDGVMLSGGQRQRLAIARALLKDAPVLILDEATSALDNRAEAHIQAALERVMQGRTTIVVAHRLSTIERADLILVMDAGRIVERGSHTELLQSGGRYAALYHRQFSDA